MIAGQRRAQTTEVLTVDYADVLRQAVANERNRILRNLRHRVGNIPTTTPARGSSYRDDDRKAEAFKKDVLREIDNEEEQP